jgi:hypothetical protein
MEEISSLCNLMSIKITKSINEIIESYKINTDNLISNKINLLTNSTLWDIIGNKDMSMMYIRPINNSSILEICKNSMKNCIEGNYKKSIEILLKHRNSDNVYLETCFDVMFEKYMNESKLLKVEVILEFMKNNKFEKNYQLKRYKYMIKQKKKEILFDFERNEGDDINKEDEDPYLLLLKVEHLQMYKKMSINSIKLIMDGIELCKKLNYDYLKSKFYLFLLDFYLQVEYFDKFYILIQNIFKFILENGYTYDKGIIIYHYKRIFVFVILKLLFIEPKRNQF